MNNEVFRDCSAENPHKIKVVMIKDREQFKSAKLVFSVRYHRLYIAEFYHTNEITFGKQSRY